MAFGFDTGPQAFIHDTWSEFKKYIDGTYATLAFQYSETSTYYKIITETFINVPQIIDLIKDSGADQLDFENNFKNLAFRNPGRFQASKVEGFAQNGAATSGNPVLIAGHDGTNVRTIKTDVDGNLNVSFSGSLSALSVGDFMPAHTAYPELLDVDASSSLRSDSNGQLITRGMVFTDEGSFRDDFAELVVAITGTLTFTNGSTTVTGSGTSFSTQLNRSFYIKKDSDGNANFTKIARITSDTTLELEDNYPGAGGSGAASYSRWIPESLINGNIAISSGSLVRFTSSGTNNASNTLMRYGDYAPFIGQWKCSISQRINNQTAFIGFRDTMNSPSMFCDVLFTGTNNTQVTFRSAWKGETQSTTVTLPFGLTTATSNLYKIDFAVEYCALSIEGIVVARHNIHIPDMYTSMNQVMGIQNSSSLSSTQFDVDSFFWSNQDQVQIVTSFADPIPVISKEDQHSISGTLTTTATTANQTIISYTVPANKIFFIAGYKVDTRGTASGSPVIIGKTPLPSEPASPGTVDSNIFRAIDLNMNTSTGDIDFALPRRFAKAGDVVVMTVTPNAVGSTVWRGAIDFILR